MTAPPTLSQRLRLIADMEGQWDVSLSAEGASWLREAADALEHVTRECAEKLATAYELDKATIAQIAGRMYQAEKERDEALGALKTMQGALRLARKEVDTYAELECRFCPEDVGFAEYVPLLLKQLAEAQDLYHAQSEDLRDAEGLAARVERERDDVAGAWRAYMDREGAKRLRT